MTSVKSSDPFIQVGLFKVALDFNNMSVKTRAIEHNNLKRI